MTKKLVLEFHDYTVKPKVAGLKYCMFRLNKGDRMLGYDFGFGHFDGEQWEELSSGDVTTQVIKWAEQPDPKLLF